MILLCSRDPWLIEAFLPLVELQGLDAALYEKVAIHKFNCLLFLHNYLLVCLYCWAVLLLCKMVFVFNDFT